LRCLPGHALALQHEGPLIASAVNRYFGYVLVKDVRMSLEPFAVARKAEPGPEAMPEPVQRAAREAVSEVGDDGLKAALAQLGEQVLGRKGR
ncbi:MAG: hypothetical protein ABL879_17535, partial [Devosia sp.]